MATISIIRVENPEKRQRFPHTSSMRCRIGSACRTARRSTSTTAETCRFSPPCRKSGSRVCGAEGNQPLRGEIYVMGVLPAYHRSGIGRQLFAAIRAEAIAQGYRLLQVKTVQTGHYEEYDRTNAFYQRMGFLPLECLPTLWDEWNPCQVYVLPLQNS